MTNKRNRNMCIMDFDLEQFDTDKVEPLVARIAAVEAATGTGKTMQVVVKQGVFPVSPDTPETDETKALLWGYKLKPTEEVPNPPDPKEWNLLVFLHEITGPEGIQGPIGPEGPAGHDGKGITLSGVVNTPNDLLSIADTKVGYAYLVLSTEEVYVCIDTPSTALSDWKNLGKIAGIKGDTGDRGPQGPQGARGPKGKAGGISSFLLSWIVSTATSAAISGVMMEVNTTLNDAINDMAMELGNLAEDAAQSALDKAIDDMMDEFKGDKGEKGDKGDDGKDGKDGAACTILGHYETELQLQTLGSRKAGSAYLVGTENNLWVWTPNVVSGVDLGEWTNVGQVRGPQGEAGKDATWGIQLLDDKDNLVGSVIDIKPTEAGTPNLYIRGMDDVIVEKSLGVVNGFTIKTKYKIPTLIPTGGVGTPTVDKFLTNNGTKLEWVDIAIDDDPKDVIKMKSPNNKVWLLTVDNNGRLNVVEETA